MRRCALSIPSNIAEECARRTESQFRHFFDIALGSASELEYQLLVTMDLGYGDPAAAIRLQSRATDIKRMLTGFIARLSKPSGGR